MNDLLITDEKVKKHLDLIEADTEGLHVHYTDGSSEFYAWQNHRFEDAERREDNLHGRASKVGIKRLCPPRSEGSSRPATLDTFF